MDPTFTPRPDRGEGFVLPGAPRPRRRGAAPLVAVAIALSLLVAACGASGTPTPVSIPPDASGSIAPPASASAPAESAAPSVAAAASFPLVLADDEGGTIQLKAAPAKIVSLTPATTETLFALGAGQRVVATTDFDDYPPEVSKLPHVATYQGVDVEKIVALAPDLVIAGGNGFNSPDAIGQLRRAGIQVLVVYGKDVAGVLHDIELVGDAIGAGPAARGLTASMQADFDRVAAAARGLPRPRTFYELDATKEIYGPAKDSFVAQMIDLAGGSPITTGDPNVFSIPLETLVAADPEVIVLGDGAYGTTAAIVAARPGWSGMTAVESGAVRPADDTLITRPGPRLAAGLRDLAIAIHPELATSLAVPSPAASASAAP